MSNKTHNNYISYVCNNCKTSRNIFIENKLKLDFSNNMKNGLILYSDVHECVNGSKEINNLYVDQNLNVRSFNHVELPIMERSRKLSIPGVKKKNERIVNFTHIIAPNDLAMILKNEILDFEIHIGNIDNKQHLKTLTSQFEMVSVELYECNTKYIDSFIQWIQIFTNNIEILIPSKLGPIVEVLELILNSFRDFPSEFDDNIMKSLLASYDVYFEIENNVTISNIGLIGEIDIIHDIISLISINKMISLNDIIVELKLENIVIAYYIFLLEQSGKIKVHRPEVLYEF